jgi:hypothetical protein
LCEGASAFGDFVIGTFCPNDPPYLVCIAKGKIELRKPYYEARHAKSE